MRRRAILLLAVMAVSLVAVASPAWAATFTVNRAGDAPDANLANGACDVNASQSRNQCTLRAAIQEANDTANSGGPDLIRFNIVSAANVKTISPASALPAITDPATIDGYTQTGASPNTLTEGNDAVLKIQLNGTNAGEVATGIEIVAPESTVKGLVINRFGGSGVVLDSEEDNQNTKVEGNYIGTNAAGTADLGNDGDGVYISRASDRTVGGTAAGARNVISGNGGAGVLILGGTALGNEVLGNYIGTNAAGTADLGNDGDGVILTGGTVVNTIGGTAAGARNVISGNGDAGVRISSVDDSGASNDVLGNFIGTNASGTAALGNDGDGVSIVESSRNTIGGTATGARNVISGNVNAGVRINGSKATGNDVLGNFIGTNAAGTADLGNLNGVVVFSADNTVGGTRAGARNVISGNVNHGIGIVHAEATGNKVEGNRIGTRADGTGDLGNGLDGVIILNASENTVGGTAGGARNVISGNDRNGVEISGDGSRFNKVLGNAIRTNSADGVNVSADRNAIAGGNTIFNNGSSGVEVTTSGQGNSILSNLIFGNFGIGINLSGGGGTPNDPDDPDTGANNRQNFPVITSAIRSTSTGRTTITGTLNSNPNEDFRIQFFVADGDSSNHGEGQTFLGETSASTNANGNTRTFSIVTQKQIGSLEVSATAINVASGDTSEFSLNQTVVPGT